MQLGYVGLGKMGKNMVLRLLEKGHEVVVWNRSPEPRREVAKAGAIAAESVEELVQKLRIPRLVWLMLPAGEVTQTMIDQLAELLASGDTVVDGANSFYKDSIRRAKQLSTKGIRFVDAGISGGPEGARHGACVMIGGEERDFKKLEPFIRDVAAHDAYQFFPGHGAGHFVKMVHNGIEYGMMQAIAEGFNILKSAKGFKIDLLKAADIYNHRSVIDSRLIDWLQDAYEQHGTGLENISGAAAESGEGTWTVETAKELGVDVPIIEGSLQFRLDSEKHPSYIGKVVSALRHQYGGHDVKKK